MIKSHELFLLVIRLICDCARSGDMSDWHFQSRLISTPPMVTNLFLVISRNTPYLYIEGSIRRCKMATRCAQRILLVSESFNSMTQRILVELKVCIHSEITGREHPYDMAQNQLRSRKWNFVLLSLRSKGVSFGIAWTANLNDWKIHYMCITLFLFFFSL